jgi:hypothetical protein
VGISLIICEVNCSTQCTFWPYRSSQLPQSSQAHSRRLPAFQLSLIQCSVEMSFICKVNCSTQCTFWPYRSSQLPQASQAHSRRLPAFQLSLIQCSVEMSFICKVNCSTQCTFWLYRSSATSGESGSLPTITRVPTFAYTVFS